MKTRFALLAVLSVLLMACNKSTDQPNPEGDPNLELTSPENVTISADGGQITITYKLTNPINGVEPEVNINSDWVNLVSITTDSLTLEVLENSAKEPRDASVMVSYAEKTSFIVSISQEKNHLKRTADWFSGYYYGDKFNPEADNYYIHLSNIGYDEDGDVKVGGWYYTFDLYNILMNYQENDEIILPLGTYELTSDCAVGTFNYLDSGHCEIDENGNSVYSEGLVPFEEGSTIVITEDSIIATVLIKGEIHQVTYTGPRPITYEIPGGTTPPEDEEILTTLTSDMDADYSNCIAEIESYGDYYEIGYSNFVLSIYPEDGIGHYFHADFVSGDLSDAFDGLYLNGYYANTLSSPFTFLPGTLVDGDLSGTWFYSSDDGYYFTDIAPAKSGILMINSNSDGTYTITIDILDDLENNISGSWTGEILIAQSSQASKRFTPFKNIKRARF